MVLVPLAAISVAFAVYQLLAKGLIEKMGSTLFTSLALSGAAVTTLVHVGIARGGLDTGVSGHYLLLAAGTGLLATVVPSFFGQGRIFTSSLMLQRFVPSWARILSAMAVSAGFLSRLQGSLPL